MRATTVRVLAMLPLLATNASAQIRVNPTGVSVSSMTATTVFLNYGGLRDQRPVEAFWCGELVPAAPAIGNKCDPATLFGSLPLRYDLSQLAAGGGVFTDVMSIPPSVVRRAYQAAERGATSSFFYVRRFQRLTGGPDEYVAVTCRLTGGGARSPLSLTDVRVTFDGVTENVLFVASGDTPPPLTAQIAYTGTGRLVGRWEVVLPGEEPPLTDDLLTEASLPVAERGTQRRFAQLERFNIFLPPDGKVTLPGPDRRRLPSATEGTYRVLLRIEASNDREGDSDLGAAGAGAGIIHSGAVAGFTMPVLLYVVAGEGARTPARGSALRLLAPPDSAQLSADSAIRLEWSASEVADFYRVDFETVQGRPVFSALLPRASRAYEAPGALLTGAGPGVRWRVTALGADGSLRQRSVWRSLRTPDTLHGSRSSGKSPVPPS
jgi:hypothetical protein